MSSIVQFTAHPATPADDLHQAKLAAIVSSLDDIIVGETLAGMVTSWNSAATRLLGYRPGK